MVGRIVLLGLILVATTGHAQILHVDRDASGPVHDGSTWCTAFTELHEALDIATFGVTIRVADGGYLPDVADLSDPRLATFRIPAGITIAGGYAGCGAIDPDARDPFLLVTELTGDLNGDDPPGGGNDEFYEDNCYHVLTAAGMTSVTTISGFVIRGGNAHPDGFGAGILAPGGRLVLSACTLTDNRAWRGGAVYLETGELHLFQCQFVGNETTGEGAAIFDWSANLEAHNSLFTLNRAGSDGGAFFGDLCAAEFYSCSFGGNTTSGLGGAIYLYVGAQVVAGNSIFWRNEDINGQSAGIHVNPSNVFQGDYCCFQGDAASFGGEGNIDDDPLFVDLVGGDLHLLPGSPCVDRGSNAMVGAQLDLDGNPRIVNATVDMGCYEFQGPTSAPNQRVDVGRPRILGVNTVPGATHLTVSFRPPSDRSWSLVIYDLRGRRLADLGGGDSGMGPTQLTWEGRDQEGRLVPSGVYLAALLDSQRVLDCRKAIRLR